MIVIAPQCLSLGQSMGLWVVGWSSSMISTWYLVKRFHASINSRKFHICLCEILYVDYISGFILLKILWHRIASHRNARITHMYVQSPSHRRTFEQKKAKNSGSVNIGSVCGCPVPRYPGLHPFLDIVRLPNARCMFGCKNLQCNPRPAPPPWQVGINKKPALRPPSTLPRIASMMSALDSTKCCLVRWKIREMVAMLQKSASAGPCGNKKARNMWNVSILSFLWRNGSGAWSPLMA